MLIQSDQDRGNTNDNEMDADQEETQHTDDDKPSPFSDSVQSQIFEDSVKIVKKFCFLTT